jgi:exonuclease III
MGYIGLDWTFENIVASDHLVHVRLDRALASSNWCARFPAATVYHLMAVKSDHCPILLSAESEEKKTTMGGIGAF